MCKLNDEKLRFSTLTKGETIEVSVAMKVDLLVSKSGFSLYFFCQIITIINNNMDEHGE